MALDFQHLGVLSFGNAVTLAGFDQDFTVHGAKVHAFSHHISNRVASTVGGVSDGYDRHLSTLLLGSIAAQAARRKVRATLAASMGYRRSSAFPRSRQDF